MTGLGCFTKAGGSLMVVAIVGGALIPALYGYLKDVFGAQNAYWICVPLFLYILYYALKGQKSVIKFNAVFSFFFDTHTTVIFSSDG